MIMMKSRKEICKKKNKIETNILNIAHNSKENKQVADKNCYDKDLSEDNCVEINKTKVRKLKS